MVGKWDGREGKERGRRGERWQMEWTGLGSRLAAGSQGEGSVGGLLDCGVWGDSGLSN